MTSTNTDGVVVLPRELDFVVNGATLTAVGAPSKKGNIWYHAAQEGDLPDPALAEAALGQMVASIGGETLKAGEVHISDVRYDRAGNKRGGGNLSVTHSGTKEIGGIDYQLQVTATVAERNRNGAKVYVVVVHAKAFPRPQNAFKPLGEVKGNLTFAAPAEA